MDCPSSFRIFLTYIIFSMQRKEFNQLDDRVEYRPAISISLSIFGIPSAQSPSIDPRNPATRSTCAFAQIKPTSYAHLRVHKSNKTNCKRAFVTLHPVNAPNVNRMYIKSEHLCEPSLENLSLNTISFVARTTTTGVLYSDEFEGRFKSWKHVPFRLASPTQPSSPVQLFPRFESF